VAKGERRQSEDPLDATTVDPASRAASVAAVVAPALTIVAHPDLERVGERAILTSLASGERVPLSRRAPAFAAPGELTGTPLTDAHVSRQPLFIEPDGDGFALVIPADATTVRVSASPVVGRRPLARAELDAGLVIELADRVVLLLHWTSPLLPRGEQLGLVGESDGIHQLRHHVTRVAAHRVPVLLRGESGTGKELVARAIHDHSPRSGESFVGVNMAAIPSSTAAAALFGHAKGAFTGAVQANHGYLGSAAGGTLFLDEIGDTPADIQAALLRALESGEVQPVGEDLPRRFDVRFVAATDADLATAVDEGRFRLSLLERLGGYEIELPPLRARRDDIPRLLVHFVREELARAGHEERLAPTGASERPWLPAWLLAAATRHDWPGNVRGLRNFAQQLVIGWCDVSEVPRDGTIERVLGAALLPPVSSPGPAAGRRRISEIGEAEVVEALRQHGYRPSAAAAALGVSRTSFFKLMKSHPTVRSASDLERTEIEQSLTEAEGDVKRAAQQLEVSERALRMRLKALGLG